MNPSPTIRDDTLRCFGRADLAPTEQYKGEPRSLHKGRDDTDRGFELAAPPYIYAIHLQKAMSVTADMLSAVIGYRDFQIPAKRYFYFLHREMLILTTGGRKILRNGVYLHLILTEINIGE